jgi:hypothetical protein
VNTDNIQGMPGTELGADVAPVQNVAQDSVHVPWPPPRLQASAIAMTATVVTSHSSSTACGKPRRWYARRVCRGSGRERRTARREPTWIFSRAGIASPDASRVNMVSRATSAGSQLARSPLIEFRARCSHVLRLTTGPSIVRRGPRGRGDGTCNRLGPDHIGVSRAGRKDLMPGTPAPNPRPVETDPLHCSHLLSSPRPATHLWGPTSTPGHDPGRAGLGVRHRLIRGQA